MQPQITQILQQTAEQLGLEVKDIHLEHPADPNHGDYATNLAMTHWQSFKSSDHPQANQINNPRDFAQLIVDTINQIQDTQNIIKKIDIAGPGFINFTLSQANLTQFIHQLNQDPHQILHLESQQGRKIMVEFAHPNTHKEMHVGHMRTLILGESLARILSFTGAQVFRANYQGDIGPHVAKSIWGTIEMLKEQNQTLDDVESLTHAEKAHLLGQGYVIGNQRYEENKTIINKLNTDIYNQSPEVLPIYQRTRQWSLDYYQDFYTRFGTTFDKLYFESQTADLGKQLVLQHTGTVFEKSDGAIIYPGEKQGLHNRVFITQDGNPTYEGKEVALAQLQYQDFQFDQVIHVVANEQAGYFQVVIAAIEKVHPELKGKEFHLSMGMVNLVGRKISSRTGEIVRVDQLIDDVKQLVKNQFSDDKITPEVLETVAEQAALGAIKYSNLKTNPRSNVAFDLEQSVSLQGDSGPYIQYAHARCRSILNKQAPDNATPPSLTHPQEQQLARLLPQYTEIIEQAAHELSPNYICTYLHQLASQFNTFYAQCPVLNNQDSHVTNTRLHLTQATATILAHGLNLLGIAAPDKM